jgi:nucleoside-diphosphate-sugar epimerase
MDRILVIGAGGQLGTELTKALAHKYGNDNIIATDFQDAMKEKFEYCSFQTLNVMDKPALEKIVEKEKVTQIYHLAAILSASGEQHPLQAWDLNMGGLLNVLEIARDHKIEKVFWPSSIAVFGPTTPANQTPQHTIMEPSTVYGISKQAGERWCEYYFNKFGVDVRSIRYPGLISYKSLPGGGTTDYAVDIFYKAKSQGNFTCFLKEDTALPMMFMDDAIRGTIELMRAPAEQIKIRSAYNLAGSSFTPAELATSIQKHLPDFTIDYAPDFRQAIADSWPNSIDDSYAQKDWGWKAEFDTDAMVKVMLENVNV